MPSRLERAVGEPGVAFLLAVAQSRYEFLLRYESPENAKREAAIDAGGWARLLADGVFHVATEADMMRSQRDESPEAVTPPGIQPKPGIEVLTLW